jgi:hypothetical protein
VTQDTGLRRGGSLGLGAQVHLREGSTSAFCGDLLPPSVPVSLLDKVVLRSLWIGDSDV